jgi:PAS domain S-box-containing protein
MDVSTEFLQSILNSLHDAVKIIDVSTESVVQANSSACELYQIRESEFASLPLSDTRFSKEIQFLKIQIESLKKEDAAKSFSFMRKSFDGEKRHCELHATKIANSNFAISITRDVSEQRMLEREVRQREKLASIGQVTSSFAHEIKNPLTGIRLGLGLLKKDEKNTDVIESIANDVSRLDGILEILLGYARVHERNKTTLNVNTLIEKSLFLLRKEAESQGIEIESDYSPIIPQVLADENEIQQVLVNVILNAIQAIEGSGRIVLRTSNYSINEIFGVLIEVEDSGSGIAEDKLHKINQLFYTTKEKGSGLGLPMSQKIIREHGGSIVFESKEGIGTIVKIFLPIDLVS